MYRSTIAFLCGSFTLTAMHGNLPIQFRANINLLNDLAEAMKALDGKKMKGPFPKPAIKAFRGSARCRPTRQKPVGVGRKKSFEGEAWPSTFSKKPFLSQTTYKYEKKGPFWSSQ